MLRKIKSIAFFTMCWLAYYQILEIVQNPTSDNQIKLAWSLFAGILLAYVVGFRSKLLSSKKSVASKE